MTESPWPRRLFWGLGVGLLAVVGGFAILQMLGRGKDFAEPDLLRELAGAKLDTVAAATKDWPGWRGPFRDGLCRETGLNWNWPQEGPTVLWEKPTGEGLSTLAVSQGNVLTMFQDGTDEAVICWDAQKSDEKWRFRYPEQFLHKYANGPRATPQVEGDRVYTVGGAGKLHCLKLNPSTPQGEVIWKKDLLEEFNAVNITWGIAWSPWIEGDLVYAVPGGPKGNSIVALDKHTGAVRWKALDDPAGYSSPIAATLAGQRQLVAFTGLGLVGLMPETGAELWRFDWPTDRGVNAATPIIAGDYVFISSGYNYGCALLKIVKNGSGFSAQKVYQNKRMRNHFSSCVLFEDHLYGFDDSSLTCLEFRTGNLVWRERGTFGKGSLLIADGHLVILAENGLFALAEATPKGYREKWRQWFAPEGSRRIWSVPVLCDGRLYVRDEERLVCYDLKK